MFKGPPLYLFSDLLCFHPLLCVYGVLTAFVRLHEVELAHILSAVEHRKIHKWWIYSFLGTLLAGEIHILSESVNKKDFFFITSQSYVVTQIGNLCSQVTIHIEPYKGRDEVNMFANVKYIMEK